MRAKVLALVLGLCVGGAVIWQMATPSPLPNGAGRDVPHGDRKERNLIQTTGSLELLVPTPPLPHAGRNTPYLTNSQESVVAEKKPEVVFPSTDLTPTVSSADPVITRSASHPSLEALRELGQQDRSFANRIVPGLGAPVSSSGPSQVLPSPTPVVSPTPTGMPLVGGQARGYAMLYLMHPRARQTVERQLQIMIEANVRDLYLGVLTDGTFGEDIDYLASIVRRIGKTGRTLTLALYLTNGATMRSFETTPITAGFNNIDPLTFRELIERDFSTQQQFLSMVRRVSPLYELNRRSNRRNRNIALVMLEDNLDAESYRVMRSLAASVLPRTVQFIRNPCLGCYEGNDQVSFDDGLESHIPGELLKGGPMSAFSLDGVGYALPGDQPSAALSADQVKQLLTAAQQRQLSFFALWRGARQGLGDASIHPDQRTYEVPTEEHRRIEIELLRYGLAPVEETSSLE